MKIKAKLVLDDWKEGQKSIYDTTVGVMLSSGDLHRGSMFGCEIDLDADQLEELKLAMNHGYIPSFILETTP